MVSEEYNNATEYIASIPMFTKKTELDNTRLFLHALGDPQNSYKAIHVAGTNGKGSVCKIIALMLEKAGYKTGLFISPHLIRINERMSVNGVDISDEDFARIFLKIKRTIDSEDKLAHPAYFEFLFLMASEYYKEQKCDYVIFETGLGGRLDATNVINPEVSIITSIGLDHMQYLGNTIAEIAGEKAGIIKPGIPVIYNTGSDEADKVIVDKCAETGSRCISSRDLESAISVLMIDKTVEERFDNIIDDFSKKIMTPYQRDNANTAVTCFLMMRSGFETKLTADVNERSLDNYDVIKQALDEFAWPARMQFIEEDTVLDGAHNEDAMIRLCEAVRVIRDEHGYDKVFVIFAAVDDKDHEKVVKLICEGIVPDRVYVTEISSGRKMDAEKIAEMFGSDLPAEKKESIIVNKDAALAYYEAKTDMEKIQNGSNDKILLVICGSLYLAGEILSIPELRSGGK